MKDITGTLEAALDYAERMVRAGFWTTGQAAETCGVSLVDLQARLVDPPRPHLTTQIKPFRFER